MNYCQQDVFHTFAQKIIKWEWFLGGGQGMRDMAEEVTKTDRHTERGKFLFFFLFLLPIFSELTAP
jgi:signal transduction histidine kinase